MTKLSKKWIILGVVVFLIIALNVVFWFWLSVDNKATNIQQDLGFGSEKTEEWSRYEDSEIVSFDVPSSFMQELTGTGVYWFEPLEKRVAFIYESFDLQSEFTQEEQLKQFGIEFSECEIQEKTNDYKIASNCSYINSIFTFVYFESNKKLRVIAIDHNQFSVENLQKTIESIDKK